MYLSRLKLCKDVIYLIYLCLIIENPNEYVILFEIKRLKRVVGSISGKMKPDTPFTREEVPCVWHTPGLRNSIIIERDIGFDIALLQ